MADDFQRIKANVQKMVSLQAPEGDIDGYLSQEGWSPDQFKAAVTQSPDVQAVTNAVTAPTAVQGMASNLQAPMQQARSLGEEGTRQLGLTGRYLAEGAAALPSLVGDAANSVINLGSAVVNKAAGTQIPKIPSMTKSVDTLLTASGLPQPQTKIERAVAEPSKFMAAIPSFGVPAAASKIDELAPLAEKYLNQTLGAAGGGTAYGVTKEAFPDNPKTQLAMLLMGTVAGNKAGGMMDTAEAASKAAIPANQQLHDAAQVLYKKVEDSGVQLTPEAMQRLTSGINQGLQKFGYNKRLHPGINAVVEEADKLAENGGSARDLVTLSRIAGEIGKSSRDNGSQQTLAGKLQRIIDDFLPSVTEKEVVAGNAPAASEDWRQADRLWSRYAKSDDLDERMYKAEIQAAATGSGGNQDNLIRQQAASILKDESKRSLYTPDEIDQLNLVARGGKVQNALRLIGKLSPGGNGLMTALGGGAGAYGLATGNPALAALPVAGLIAAPIARSMTKANVSKLSDIIRAGGEKDLVKALASQSSAAPSASTLTASQRSLLQTLLEPYKGNNGLQPSYALSASPNGTSGQNTPGQFR